MNLKLLLKNMYQFWKSGNSLENLYAWLKDGYGNENAKVLMCSFVKEYESNKELKEEFNSSCFIENTHDKIA